MACRGLWISAGGYCQTRVGSLISYPERDGKEGHKVWVKRNIREVRGGLLQWEARDCYW